MSYKTTKELAVPKHIIDQVIGQEEAAFLIKKIAKQKRHLLLIGQPGTGKSLLGQALSELISKESLKDVLAYPNPSDENVPIIKVVPKGKGREAISKARIQAMGSFKNQNFILFIFVIIAALLPYYFYSKRIFPFDSPIVYAASMITSMVLIIGFMLFLNLSKRMNLSGNKAIIPKLLIDNADKDSVPFIDATGSHAGALLGDCLHDPLQSGGLGTPPHERLVPGFIHRASGGVLFIDEIGTLDPHSQQELLTALQEKKYPITGQSERSSGAMTRSEPVPTDFIMVAAGNIHTIKRMHPALRSRIRGYGYEVYMNTTMEDTPQNREKLAYFVAQEVEKDGKIPPFTKEAVDLIINEARRMASMSGKLTVRLRELGGIVRAAGDLALESNSKFVLPHHILKAKTLARPLEQQLADKYIADKRKYEVIITKGNIIGRVNGLAVIGSQLAFSGIVLPIESEVTLGGNKTEFIATGNLGDIAKEAVKNVSAIILKHFGEDLKKYDIFTQFIQTTEGVEGDSASIAVATSIISALKNIPVRQDTAMTGSLSVRGEVLAVGGITAKVEAAIEAGISYILVPKANKDDIIIPKEKMEKIKIIPVANIKEVLAHALTGPKKEALLKKIK
ncbi:ATP-dependent protease LonB [archaeon]|nr:ATP-dependent protease LonB [archaeon]